MDDQDDDGPVIYCIIQGCEAEAVAYEQVIGGETYLCFACHEAYKLGYETGYAHSHIAQSVETKGTNDAEDPRPG